MQPLFISQGTMKLIVGLGNPGRIYENTRHNIGFKVIDALSKKSNIKLKRVSLNAMCGRGRIFNERVILAKPLTYMNLSGSSIKNLMLLNKIKPENLMVILDDADLGFGRIKLKARGSSAGHRGLASIIEQLGTNEFARLRIGIGRQEGKKLVDYVLDEFKNEERKKLKEAVEISYNALMVWIKEGIEASMNRFNSTNIKNNGGNN